MPNYLTYPFRTMRITQRYDGTTSHLPHMTGTPKEYALDEGGKDTGRDWVFCPCDEMKVTRLTGVGKPGTNALYLTSTAKCDLANGKKSVVTLQLVHPNDDDLKKLKVGQVFKRGEKICREGNDGATGYHIHLAVGLGTIVGTGWQLNSKNKWVLVTTGDPIKPEDAFFVDPAVTTVKDSAWVAFREVAPVAGTYRVTANTLRVRYGTSADTAVMAVLGKGATAEISKVKVSKTDGLYWGKIDGKGWICLKYAERVRT